MDTDTLYATLLIAALVWWMWRANTSKKPTEHQVLRDGQPPTYSEEPTKDDDSFLHAIQAERIAAEREARNEGDAYKRAIEAQVSNDEKLKARLTKVAKDNRLDTALAQLWDDLRHYPAWSKRADWPQWNVLGVDNPSEEPSQDFRDKTIHFDYKGTRYSIAAHRWDGIEETTYQDFELREDGEEVFAISCEVVHDEVMTWYSPTDVKAFKKQGKWASMLVQLIAKKDLASEKASADLRARMASDISKRFSE